MFLISKQVKLFWNPPPHLSTYDLPPISQLFRWIKLDAHLHKVGFYLEVRSGVGRRWAFLECWKSTHYFREILLGETLLKTQGYVGYSWKGGTRSITKYNPPRLVQCCIDFSELSSLLRLASYWGCLQFQDHLDF